VPDGLTTVIVDTVGFCSTMVHFFVVLSWTTQNSSAAKAGAARDATMAAATIKRVFIGLLQLNAQRTSPSAHANCADVVRFPDVALGTVNAFPQSGRLEARVAMELPCEVRVVVIS
jgi:hypothetical protein